MTTMHARSLLAEASRFAERLGVPLALIHATTGEAESQAHLREAANQLAIPIEKHIVRSKSESAQALLSAAEQADIELLVAGAFEGPALNRRRFLSSAARKMVDSARCSLLLLREFLDCPQFSPSEQRCGSSRDLGGQPLSGLSYCASMY